MIDIATLRGATVRDNAGTLGELMSLSLPWVKVGWQDEGKLLPREESFLRSDPRMESILILTLDAGWVPLGDLVGTEKQEGASGPRGPSLVEDLELLLEFDLDAALAELAGALEQLDESALSELAEQEPEALLEFIDPDGLLLEKKPRSPFKTAASIGPGPRHGWKGGAQRHAKRDYWDCSGSNYKYTCKGREGEVKKITVKPGWKKTYNRQYKQFQKDKMAVAAPMKTFRKREKARRKKPQTPQTTTTTTKTQAKKPGLVKRIISKVKSAVQKLRGK